ncbi:MAG TPA: non-canonical purine NTP pyrophosphatase [Conexibacter sp.]|nr:non-canonical purine NTP pyrophosphatase [Conexibacter sp.]
MRRLLLATRNAHKLREFARLAEGGEGGPISIDPLPDEVELPPEDGATFADNALGKARAAAAALGGRPGVRSARYAGEQASDAENLAKLLREAPPGSPLAYVCALAYVDPAAGVEQVFEERCTGTLAVAPRGAGGFGYDPAFLPDDGAPDRTMAELSDAQKDAISHRGRAVRALRAWLPD